MKLARSLQDFGFAVTVTCNPEGFNKVENRVQGVLYIPQTHDELDTVDAKYFSNRYKWVIISEHVPLKLHTVRYDSDIILAKIHKESFHDNVTNLTNIDLITMEDIYVHPQLGASRHPWGIWTPKSGLQVFYDRDRMLRRLNLKKYPLKVAVPLGLYTNDTYSGSFEDYLRDMAMPERDSGIRCGFTASSLIIQKLNATEILVPTQLWSSETNNESMLMKVSQGTADICGGVLRIMHSRVQKLDYAMSIWPFHVGFTYLAERESSNNMFVAPFTMSVWLCCSFIFAILLGAQKITAKSEMEKEGAFMAVLATFLQQDASAVPHGISGRWTFLVLSISAMLVHAYYTSAIVSALMSTGRSGPDSLRALGDSRYEIASEDYDYMRYLMFDVQTNWEDLEYLKRKKMNAKFYQNIQTGVKMIRDGQVAYHTEFNQLYPHLSSFTDDQLCKLQFIDTVPEILSWIATTKRGQWTDMIKSTGSWLHETGLAKRTVSRLRIKPPPCLASLLAERVNIYDIAPVLVLTLMAVVLSLIILLIEYSVAKFTKQRKKESEEVSEEEFIEDNLQ
ncbi:ionotropic receptor 75a-like [Leptidea sinapis]|uniref:ionotropic receptor 75a-like n=1 Tax=Leptidea sinapis TaxID=189913 RepID=UPI0021C4C604|nr:ionotropic receptor 75a-like [Leptidea sinapis]